MIWTAVECTMKACPRRTFLSGLERFCVGCKLKSVQPDAEAGLDAELALATITGLRWLRGVSGNERQITWRGHVLSYERITNGRAPPDSAQVILRAPDGVQLARSMVAGKTDTELEHQAFAWALRTLRARSPS